MEHINEIHLKTCPRHEKNIQTSVDGVSESKSSTTSIDIYSSKFRKCRYIYPMRIVRPLKKNYVDNNEQFKHFIHDITETSTTISALIADNLKRANVRLCLNHSALFACEYCYAKGTKFTGKTSPASENSDVSRRLVVEKIKTLETNTDPDSKKTCKVLKKILLEIDKNKNAKQRTFTIWPFSTANKEMRTKASMLDIVSKIEENEENEDNDELSKDEVKGVVGRSVLLDLDSFDFVNGVPTEYMHLGCLGVVKRLTELTFNVGLNRSRITKRKLSSTKEFNALMAKTKVVFEFSRRSRDLHFSVYKAEEFRNMILFFFPHVLSCLEKNAKERELWLYLAFMIRSCILPDNEFFNLNTNEISMACEKFYKLYEKLFGGSNCTYSVHVLCCHLLQIRELGPLTETSAFKFESFYGEIRNSFTPGTPSTLKQMFENVLLKRSLSAHSCEKSIYLSNYDTALQSNSLFYTYKNDEVNMYKFLHRVDGEITCNPQGKFACEFQETSNLSWSSIGVFQKGPQSNETIKISEKSVAGKVLKVGTYLITCPENVLKEK